MERWDVRGGEIYVGKGRLQRGMEAACRGEMLLDAEDRRLGRGGGGGLAVLRSPAGTAGGRVGGRRTGRGMSVWWTGMGPGVDAGTLVEAVVGGICVERGDGRGVGWGVFCGPDGMGGVGGEPGTGGGLAWCVEGAEGVGGGDYGGLGGVWDRVVLGILVRVCLAFSAVEFVERMVEVAHGDAGLDKKRREAGGWGDI